MQSNTDIRWIECVNAQISSAMACGGESDAEMLVVLDALVTEMFEAHAEAFGLRCV